jgi:hypothetical protein
MHDALTTYFQGEKNAGLLIAGIGVAILALAAVFYQPRWSLRSFAVTLAVFALVEIAIGVALYLRTGPQVTSLLAQLGGDSARFFAEEGARMARVQRNFVVIQYIELVVIVTAAIAAIPFRNRFALAGIALGLLCHAAFLLAFDLIAERRGAIYLSKLRTRSTALAAPASASAADNQVTRARPV